MSTLVHPGTVSERRRNRRRNHIVRPGFQLRFAAVMGLTVFITCSIISSVLYGVLHQQARLRAMNPESYTAEVPLVLLGFGLLFAAVAAGAFAIWCLFFTHRIVGPLVVLEQYLNELAQGRFPEVRSLRKNDELKELFAALERAVTSLKESRTS